MHSKSLFKVLGLTTLLIIISCSLSFAQIRTDEICVARGLCTTVFEELKNTYGDDSIAAQRFIQNYSIDNQVTFSQKQWKEAIRYIYQKKNKELKCSLKSYIREKSLIDDKKL